MNAVAAAALPFSHDEVSKCARRIRLFNVTREHHTKYDTNENANENILAKLGARFSRALYVSVVELRLLMPAKRMVFVYAVGVRACARVCG